MTSADRSLVTSPLAVAIGETCLLNEIDLGQISDADVYQLIVHVNLTLTSPASSQPSSEEVRRHVVALAQRLNEGWFAPAALPRRQSRFGGCRPVIGPVGETFVGGADKPAGAIWTSSYLPDGTSAWAPIEAVSGAEPDRPLRAVDVVVDESRIFRLRSWGDYLTLVDRYPDYRVSGRTLVRWRRVALDYDAVNLTVQGLVDTHGRVERRQDGRVVELRGWDAECTAWLVDRLVNS